MKQIFKDFDSFRKWFNRFFSLSLNGKFVGLARLQEHRISWQRFQYKLYKVLNGYYRRKYDDILVFHFHGV